MNAIYFEQTGDSQMQECILLFLASTREKPLSFSKIPALWLYAVARRFINGMPIFGGSANRQLSWKELKAIRSCFLV